MSRSTPLRAFRQKVEIGAFVAAERTLSLSRRAQWHDWEHGFATVFGRWLQTYRPVVDANLRVAFPEMSAEARAQLAFDNYRWFARLALDIVRMPSWRGRTAELIQLHNVEVLEAALAEGNGVLLVSGHFGNWELITPALAEAGFPMSMYVGAQTNPASDAHQNRNRASFGVETIGKSKNAALHIGRTLGNNRVLAMLVDQNDSKSDLFVNFFGKAATMSKGLGGFHRLKHSPIVFATSTYAGSRSVLRLEKLDCPITGDKALDVQHTSQRFSDALEAAIRRAPEQYFWMHRRWRKRPQHDPQPIY
jgi:KDO2-lipid IV(A) lauroyltransferase